MTKTEKKIQIVKQMLESCVTSGTNAFTYGNIPRNRYNGAKKNYAYDAQYDDVIALVDTTVFGGGERGMVITLQNIYIKEIMSSPEKKSLSQCMKIHLPGDTYFNRDNLCLLLSNLQEIENSEEEKKTAGGFWSFLGELAETVIEEGIKAYNNEIEKQREEEERETLEQLENIRDNVEEFGCGLDELVASYDDLEDEGTAYSQIMTAAALSCLLANNYEKYKSIVSDIEMEEDNAKELMESTQAVVEILDDLSIDEFDGIEPLSRTFKRFNSTMIKIIGEIKTEMDDEDIEEVDIEDYYDRMQKSVKTAKKKLNELINYLNGEIENAYEE